MNCKLTKDDFKELEELLVLYSSNKILLFKVQNEITRLILSEENKNKEVKNATS